jgi:hypothetical protein
MWLVVLEVRRRGACVGSTCDEVEANTIDQAEAKAIEA